MTVAGLIGIVVAVLFIIYGIFSAIKLVKNSIGYGTITSQTTHIEFFTGILTIVGAVTAIITLIISEIVELFMYLDTIVIY